LKKYPSNQFFILLKKAQAVVQKAQAVVQKAQAVVQKTLRKKVTSTVLFLSSVLLMEVMGRKITVNLK
jgi:hypothetical protein